MKKIQRLFSLMLVFLNFLIKGNANVPVHQEKYNFISLDYVLKKYPDITYQKCHGAQFFDYGKFPFSLIPKEQPHYGMFAETFVLTIPQGRCYSHEDSFGYKGCVLVDNQYVIRDLIAYSDDFFTMVNRLCYKDVNFIRHVPGRVVVLTKNWSFVYGHWMNEVLGRLAMIEFLGIEYDWLLIPAIENRRFMLETLELWGIDKNKIIESKGEFSYMEADELIVPSIPGRRQAISGETFDYVNKLCLYFPNFVIQYLRDKFIAKSLTLSEKPFAKRVFISRADAPGCRRIVNEDEIFAVLEKHGFVRYILSNLSFVEQVVLFNQAEIIISPNGSGLTNVMFCNKSAQVVEIFQARADSTFYNIAMTLGLKYMPVKTQDFTGTFGHEWTYICPSIMEQIIKDLYL